MLEGLNFIIDNVYFPNLVDFSCVYKADNFSLEKLISNKPNLKKLHLLLNRAGYENVSVFDHPIPNLENLSVHNLLVPEDEVCCHIDLSKYPELKSLNLAGYTELVNFESENFATKVKKLELIYTQINISKVLISEFPNLKYLHLNCALLDSDQLYSVFKISGHLKQLKIDEINKTRLPSTFPIVGPSLTKLTITGRSYMTDSFLTWLAHHTTLKHINFQSLADDHSLSYRELKLDALEELSIQTVDQFDTLKCIFHPPKFPKLTSWWIRDFITNEEIRDPVYRGEKLNVLRRPRPSSQY